MKLTLDLPTDASIGLRRAANEANESLESTAVELLRDILIGQGFIERLESVNDNQEGDA